MTSASDSEPTLRDLSNKLDRLSSDVGTLSSDVGTLSNDVETFSGDLKKFDERFADYRQATQWVVQLAFTLIASATLTVIITSVLRR
ncbi:hypothetical protein [Thermoleptolyngbya sp. C42_A2020_037]|uniref:hypothetical protein n=1 Tax=Thermoleptolyngbya sp. C42_A2020_037 TaxID=2747799 RepID=UPI0019EFC3A2|nr:hypothetical protein [Thermoleptolyngbya sp. C42_A2020_037]MBF2083331.1 hypothetical protein [Thermoleptolyngbya sp. C42_A2020_037]